MGNLVIWNAVKSVPMEHLSNFKRAGGFSGTAIKPMWSVMVMTELFGPCGEGWGIDAPSFTTLPGIEGETMVYCTVSVWHGKPENKVWGVGGDRVVGRNKYGLSSDDEAFKKAFTDAVTNGLKFLGVGADVHMGRWDGNKYIDTQPSGEQSGRKPLVTESGEAATPKAKARGPFEAIQDGARQIGREGSHEDLDGWYRAHAATIEGFSADWHEQIMEIFTEARNDVSARLGPSKARAKATDNAA